MSDELILFTKYRSPKCMKICFLMTNKALSGILRLLRNRPRPQKKRRQDALRALRPFIFEKVRKFLIAEKGQKCGRCQAAGPPRGCNGVLVGVQRRPRCNAVRAPLQSREGATEPHPGPPQGKDELTSFIND